jgi:polyisoprenoid-binding protein YceI
MVCVAACALTASSVPAQAPASGVPVFKITPLQSTIKFGVKASVPIEGTFKKWDATLTFTSTDVQTGADTFEVDGNFTIRGVTKDEKLQLQVSGVGTGSGIISGVMAFDRKQYGMNSGIPFIKIADRVEVGVSLKGERISGPPMVLKKF